MGALAIAFDTIIVGALALPWVYLVIHLFFFEDENQVQNALDWISDNNLQAVAAVLLFAMTYTLGSVVERIAQDFLNDDDLNIPYVFRMTVTEDRIIASVYCGFEQSQVLPSPATTQKLERRPSTCDSVLVGFGKHKSFYTKSEEEDEEDKLISMARDIFGMQENDLLLKGEDKTLRLRQLHDQIMVLRGATFNGLVAFALCLYAWGLRARRKKRHILHWTLAGIPVIFLLLAIQALHHHLFVKPDFSRPPYMEFSLLVIGGAGAYLLWPFNAWPFRSGKSKAANSSDKSVDGSIPNSFAEEEEQGCIFRWKWGLLSFLFAVFFVAGLLGWWATEHLYGQQVIYSYDSQITAAK